VKAWSTLVRRTLEAQLADLPTDWSTERQRTLVAALNEIADTLDRAALQSPHNAALMDVGLKVPRLDQSVDSIGVCFDGSGARWARRQLRRGCGMPGCPHLSPVLVSPPTSSCPSPTRPEVTWLAS
jgi:hypothetical protein